MQLSHIDNTIAAWKSHRLRAGSLGCSSSDLDELESYMLRSVILMIVSEYEVYLEKVFAKRAERANDPHLHSFMKKYCDRRFRSPDLGKIREILKWLGGDYDKSFWDVVEQQKPQIKASWESLLTARHAIVHKAGIVNLTWRDLETAYANSQIVIDELVKAVGLTSAEAKNL